MRKKIFLLATLLLLGSVRVFAQKEATVDVVRISASGYGDFLIYLYDRTPIHKANFLELIRTGFYDGTTFHRVVDKFVVQGGDPNSRDDEEMNDGMGGPRYTGKANTQRDHEDTTQYTIPAEIIPGIFHKRGALGAARNENPGKRSSGSQFYIVTGRTFSTQELENAARRGIVLSDEQKTLYTTVGGTPQLDGKYTVFGEVIAGINYADSMTKVVKNNNDRPFNDITMTVKVEKMSLSQLKKDYGWTVPAFDVKETPKLEGTSGKAPAAKKAAPKKPGASTKKTPTKKPAGKK